MSTTMEQLIVHNNRISEALDVVRRANNKMMHELCNLQTEHYNDGKELIIDV